MDLTDEALLALQVSGVKLPPGLLSDGNPVDDGELFPVDGVGIEGPVVGTRSVSATPRRLVTFSSTSCSDLKANDLQG